MQSRIREGVRQEEKHVAHAALTRKRPLLPRLQKAARWLLLSCQDQHGWSNVPGKDVSLPQPLLWTGAPAVRRPRPPNIVTG
jgi:hypothetical protein